MKSLLLRLGSRSIFITWLFNAAALALHAVRLLPGRFAAGQRYTEQADRIGSDPGAAFCNDPGLNFFARLILENGYNRVIELGAYTADRSLRLARLPFPQRPEIFALDITRDYAQRHTRDGVTIAPNTFDMVEELLSSPGRGLLCSHGTLCCYAQGDLEKLLGLAFDRGFDIAIAEPNSIFEESMTRSLRRTTQSYYHPYLTILRRLGYQLPDNKGKQTRDCYSQYMETRTFIFARHPQA
jgi:hypothetical protein